MRRLIMVSRVADMHPTRALQVVVMSDGDIHLYITQGGAPIGGVDTGDVATQSAALEFCSNGGRSRHTMQALVALADAMKRDEAERPIVPLP